MKKLLLLIIWIPMLAFSQEKEVLRYFITKDTLVGVKNQKGEIIVPAQFRIYSILEDGDPVKGNTIFFDGWKKDVGHEKNMWGYVYDRKGNFLYRPYFYDNGADFFEEGVQRFVKNGKVGFADRNGKVVIEPEHDFVSPFNYGYAAFCDGCDWEKTEDEHKAIVGGTWGVMNFKGEIVQPIAKKSEKDVKLDGKYYPYPFGYNEKEKNILQFFERQNKLLSDLHYVNFYPKLSENEKKLFFEIVERPKENFPYYKVYAYDYNKYSTSLMKFIVSEDGKKVYEVSFFDEDEKTPFETWLKKEIKAAIQYQKEHPDNPNKFNK
ncbi:WG repeat-containing protein [Chryseobacterium daecheongense]|uniref:WG repeat protein n=1 Tax=Chryseobacterium daecheongense TaxID=192389 RepID=A0A3N0W505_9FLAO|nr:WG repeat-containing protein [Chryseobacterium daecheongense]ROI00132.1 WG repeat-containing protein [Chryseobacterium daecheongense]TDX94919.1 WG repeat protein [Chryseobacterium daecheongense]